MQLSFLHLNYVNRIIFFNIQQSNIFIENKYCTLKLSAKKSDIKKKISIKKVINYVQKHSLQKRWCGICLKIHVKH